MVLLPTKAYILIYIFFFVVCKWSMILRPQTKNWLVTCNLVTGVCAVHCTPKLHLTTKRNRVDRVSWGQKCKYVYPRWCVSAQKKTQKHIYTYMYNCTYYKTVFFSWSFGLDAPTMYSYYIFRLDAHIFVSSECNIMCVGYTFVKANDTIVIRAKQSSTGQFQWKKKNIKFIWKPKYSARRDNVRNQCILRILVMGKAAYG